MASRINQSLSFHTSPESFISSRLQQLIVDDPDLYSQEARSRSILRASILDRNVHIVSSYRVCNAILNDVIGSDGEEDCPVVVRPLSATTPGNGENDEEYFFAAKEAYAQFMSAFFPGPNILLEDGHDHSLHKSGWKHLLDDLPSTSANLVKSLIKIRFVDPLVDGSKQGRSNVDLYNTLKALSWDILFGVFLALDRDKEKTTFTTLEHLQEDLLRGQFSLFPVKVWTPFWSSARSKGLQAVKDIRRLFKDRITTNLGTSTQHKTCPYLSSLGNWDQLLSEGASLKEGVEREDDVISHTLLFTSSIANKALASLLTAYILNLFLWRSKSSDKGEDTSLADLVRSQSDVSTRTHMLESILSETERLSPPVVGVMRRVQKGVAIQNQMFCKIDEPTNSFEHTIPAGHDAWLYLAGASRDAEAFDNPEQFLWDRYMQDAETNEHVRQPLAFGGGPKKCLGSKLARQICITVAETILLDSDLNFRGAVKDRGVRYWLGWEKDVPLNEVASGLKQLPCQRPRKPVMVEVSVRKD